MGALRQPRLNEPGRKGPAKETTAGSKLDKYGRDPKSLPEQLRVLTDYSADTGYGPAYHAMVVDLTRLASGAICYAFVLTVNALSYGRPRGPKDPRHTSTLPVSAGELAEYCRCNVKGIQRQLDELKERGMISVKTLKQAGGVKYVISLLYEKWQAIEDYAVWARRQVVEIDAAGDEESDEDEAPLPISKQAVRLTKGRETVRPGRAARPRKVNVGVNSFQFRSNDSRLDLTHETVIQSGCLIVSVASKSGEGEAKGEDKANAERHPCRDIPPNGGSNQKRSKSENAPHSKEIVSLFDPLLQKSGSKLIAFDELSLRAACAELGSMPKDVLTYFVLQTGGRGSRPISGPKAVASIIKEARQNWEAGKATEAHHAGRVLRCVKCGKPDVMDVQAGLCCKCLE